MHFKEWNFSDLIVLIVLLWESENLNGSNLNGELVT